MRGPRCRPNIIALLTLGAACLALAGPTPAGAQTPAPAPDTPPSATAPLTVRGGITWRFDAK